MKQHRGYQHEDPKKNEEVTYPMANRNASRMTYSRWEKRTQKETLETTV